MRKYDKFYINGQWVQPNGTGTSEVTNPATGEISAVVPMGNSEDVDAAVAAAKEAFKTWSTTSASEREGYLRTYFKDNFWDKIKKEKHADIFKEAVNDNNNKNT